MPNVNSEVVVGRRYLERGFLDAAMNLFNRNAEDVGVDDWTLLAERLMERNRVADVVSVCHTGGVQLPRERLLELGDGYLRRRDIDNCVHYYELGYADQGRWVRVLDVLTGVPGRQALAVSIVERHLVDSESPDDAPHLHVVK